MHRRLGPDGLRRRAGLGGRQAAADRSGDNAEQALACWLRRLGGQFVAEKAETSDDLAKEDAERAEREDLAKRLAERDAAFDKMSERLEKVASDLTARLARVEAAPRAAKTAGPGASAIAISKAEDSVGGASQDAPRQELSQDAIAKALSEMSEEDRTMALIKAARATPKAITYR